MIHAPDSLEGCDFVPLLSGFRPYAATQAHEGCKVEQKYIDCPTVEQSRTLRIEADAIRTLVAIAIFGSLDARADAALTIEQSRKLRPAISLEHQDAISWLPSVFR